MYLNCNRVNCSFKNHLSNVCTSFLVLTILATIFFPNDANSGRRTFFTDWVTTADCAGNRTVEVCNAWCLGSNGGDEKDRVKRVISATSTSGTEIGICQAKSKPLKCPAPYQLRVDYINGGTVDAWCEIYCPPGATWDAQKKTCSSPKPSRTCATFSKNPIDFIKGQKVRKELVMSAGNVFPINFYYHYNSLAGHEKTLRGDAYSRGVQNYSQRVAVINYAYLPSTYEYYYPAQNGQQIEQFKGNRTSYWRHNYEDALVITTEQEWVWHHPDGRTITFEDGTSSVYSDYVATKQLSKNNSTIYKIVSRNGLTRIFDETGRFTKLVNNLGQSHNIIYFGDTFKIEKIVGPAGSELSFIYEDAPVQTAASTNAFNIPLIKMVNDSAGRSVKLKWNLSEASIIRDQYLLAELSFPYKQNSSPEKGKSYRYEDPLWPTALTDIHFSNWSNQVDENGVVSDVIEIQQPYAHFQYDQYGRAIISELAEGVEHVSVEYQGSATSVTNAFGKITNFNFSDTDGVRRLASIQGEATLSCAETNTYYSYSDLITSKTNERGFVTKTVRNDRGLVEQTTTAMQWTNGIDSSLVTTPESQRTLTNWLPSVNKIDTQTSQHLLADGSWESYRVVDYDWLNDRHIKKITVSDPRDPAKIQVTNYGYTFHDADEIIVASLTIDGPRTDVADVVTYEYNSLGQLIKFTNTLGQETQYLDYTPSGLVQTIISPNGVTASLTYNIKQLVETVTQVHPSGDVSKNRTTSFTYTFDDQLERVTSTDGTFIEYEYDAARRLDGIVDNQGNRMEYDLDAAGNIESETIKNSLGETKYSLTKRYDELSRLRKVIQNFGQETDYNYDVVNNLEDTINGRDYPTTYDVDALNRITSIFDAQNNETKMTYTADDVIKKVTDARGLETVYDYDGLGNLISLNSPDTGLTSYTHDNAGNVLTVTDNKGLVQTYTYDALNRVTVIAYSNGELGITYGYDDTANGNYGIGKLTSITDTSGTIAYTYNFAGQLTGKAYSIASLASASNSSYTVDYGYDNYGRFNTVTYPSGRIVTYHYDIAGQIASITTQEDSNATPQTVINSITYLPFGPVESFIYGNGVQRLFNYDLDYKLASIAAQGNSVIMDRTYYYDLNNNIEDIVDNTSQVSELFTYDFLDRLDTANGTYGAMDYDYDAVGNRTKKIATNGTDITTEVYTPSTTSNQLDTIAITQNGNTSTRDFGYDLNGNLETDSTTGQNANQNITLTNNASNRPASWSDGQTTVQTSYNALGQRTVKHTPEKEEYFHYNEAGKLIAVSSNGEYVKEYIYFGSEVVAILAQDNQENANKEPQNHTANSAMLNRALTNKHLTQNALEL